MATEPMPTESRPSTPARIARKVVEPVNTVKRRRSALLAAAAALMATAPFPFGPIGAAFLMLYAVTER